jgi:hypothetical protein
LGTALAALAARKNTHDSAIVAARGASVLVRWMTALRNDSEDLDDLGQALAALTAPMDTHDAAITAARGASILCTVVEEQQKKTPLYGTGDVREALGALAARMNPTDAATLANRLATVVEKQMKEAGLYDVGTLSDALVALAARMSPTDATTMAARLTTDLENGEKSYHPPHLESLGSGLAALAARMSPTDAATLAARVTTALEAPQRNDGTRLSALGQALAALAARMNPNDAVMIAARGALVLAKVQQNPKEGGSDNLTDLPSHLTALATMVPKAARTHLAALSLLFLSKVPPPPGQGETEAQERTTIARIAALLTTQELAEVLKWPFCVGEAQKLVLAELGKRTHRDFGGDVWNFVDQVDSLGVHGLNAQLLDLPAKRPPLEDAVKELQSFIPPAHKSL